MYVCINELLMKGLLLGTRLEDVVALVRLHETHHSKGVSAYHAEQHERIADMLSRLLEQAIASEECSLCGSPASYVGHGLQWFHYTCSGDTCANAWSKPTPANPLPERDGWERPPRDEEEKN